MALTVTPAELTATALTLTTAAQPNITSVGTLSALTVSGNLNATLTTAAQTNITSVGTLTALQVDNININTNTISTTAGTDLLITPVAGQQIVLDGTIIIDAGVVTGATSITSTAFAGDITGDVTGNSDTATTSTNVTVADESSDTTCFPLFATAATGNLPPKSGSNLTFNSSSGLLTATSLAGTVTTATQNSITTATGLVSVGALNSGTITSGFGNIDTGSSTITTTGLISGGSLDIDNVLINGTTIGHTDDTDLITLADGVVTVAGEISVTTLDIGAVNVTSTAAELNILDASAGNAAVASDVATNAGAVTSNTAKISHTITLNANLANDAIHADIVVTSDKCLATSVVMASSSLAVGINIHTIAAGSFKVSITNLTGAQMDDDSTLVVNYRII